MRTKTALLTLAGLSAFVLLSGFHGGCGGRPSPERAQRFINLHIDDELDDLKATPEQRQKIHALADGLFPEAAQMFQDHQKARAQAVELLAQDQVNGAQLHALVDQRIDAFRAFAHKAVDAVISAHDTLNAQQRAQLIERARKHAQE